MAKTEMGRGTEIMDQKSETEGEASVKATI